MRTVLAVDDDPMFRELVVEILGRAGYRALSAVDGQDGWEQLTAHGADMAVLDLNMPRLDGLGLIRRIRSDVRFADMPVMLLTIRDLVADQVAGLERGADDYVTKPFDTDVFLARLKAMEHRILDKK